MVLTWNTREPTSFECACSKSVYMQVGQGTSGKWVTTLAKPTCRSCKPTTCLRCPLKEIERGRFRETRNIPVPENCEVMVVEFTRIPVIPKWDSHPGDYFVTMLRDKAASCGPAFGGPRLVVSCHFT